MRRAADQGTDLGRATPEENSAIFGSEDAARAQRPSWRSVTRSTGAMSGTGGSAAPAAEHHLGHRADLHPDRPAYIMAGPAKR